MEKEIDKVLENRKIKKKRKPTYLRTDWYKKSRIGRGRRKKQKWRRPKGRHNKVRLRRKGKPKRPEIGYGSPRLVKGFIRGLKPIKVIQIKDLEKIDKTKEIAIIDGKLGLRKKLEIVKKARELGIHTNLDLEKFLEKTETLLKIKKEKREIYEKKLKEKEKAKKPKEEKEKEKAEIERDIEKEKEELKKPVTEKIHKVSEAKRIEQHRMALEK